VKKKVLRKSDPVLKKLADLMLIEMRYYTLVSDFYFRFCVSFFMPKCKF
jgi:hypothetical protein